LQIDNGDTPNKLEFVIFLARNFKNSKSALGGPRLPTPKVKLGNRRTSHACLLLYRSIYNYENLSIFLYSSLFNFSLVLANGPTFGYIFARIELSLAGRTSLLAVAHAVSLSAQRSVLFLVVRVPPRMRGQI